MHSPRNRFAARLALVCFGCELLPAPAYGGMTSYTLSDVARLRIEELSFFAVVLLLCAAAIKVLWNVFVRDFPGVPRLDWKRAFALTALLSVLMLLTLSMISGARELLTPGAWKRQGTSYKLNTTPSDSERRAKLENLRATLFEYAKQHSGAFPKHDFDPEIPEAAWQSPDKVGTHFIYIGRRSMDQPRALLALEPQHLGTKRYALFTDGEIVQLSAKEIETLLEKPDKE